jgi:DsbC/DsbD-like thiol-disulfide interchange protein
MDKLTVSDVEVSAWYESHKDRYQRAEERRASHILILVDADQNEEKGQSQSGWHSPGASGIAGQVCRTGQTAFAGSGLCAKRR